MKKEKKQITKKTIKNNNYEEIIANIMKEKSKIDNQRRMITIQITKQQSRLKR